MVSLVIELYKLNNFNACNIILLGLSLPPVTRLNQTWAHVKKKYPKIFRAFEDMQDLFAFQDNFALYKKTLSQLAPPCIPTFSLILMDLRDLDNYHNAIIKIEEKDYINIEKMVKLSDMTQILDLYKQPYNLANVEIIYNFLASDIIFLGDDVLLEKSKEIEKPQEGGESNSRKSVLIRNNSAQPKHRKSILVKEKEKDKGKKKKDKILNL